MIEQSFLGFALLLCNLDLRIGLLLLQLGLFDIEFLLLKLGFHLLRLLFRRNLPSLRRWIEQRTRIGDTKHAQCAFMNGQLVVNLRASR